MRRSLRAQTATEYMVILAVVIIIALIVAAILGQFPAIGSSARGRSSTAYWQIAEIGIVAYSISEDGSNDDLAVKVRNNMKDTITIETIDFDGAEIYNTSTTMGPGETRLLEIDDIGDFCSSSGDSYTINVNITYSDDETGETYSFIGNGNKLEGRCAN